MDDGAVVAGTANAGKTYYFANTSTATPGVSNLTFTEVPGGGGGSYTAGDGLTLTGSDFDIDLSDTTIFTTTGTANRAVSTNTNGGIVATHMLYGTGVTRASAGTFTVGTTTQTGMTIGRVGATTNIDSSVMQLASAGNIALRPTGDTVDTLVCTVASGACKLSSTKAIKIESTAGATASAIDLVAPSNSTITVGAGGLAFSANGAITHTAGSSMTISASGGQLLCSASSNAYLYNANCGIYNHVVTGECEIRAFDTKIALTDAGSIETVKRTNSGYSGLCERRYFYGEVTAASATPLTGTFTPSITNGAVRVVTNVVARRTVGGTGGFGITTSSTFTVVSGVVTQVGTFTELAPAEETAAGTGVYHDTASNQIRLIAIGIASETWRFEGYTEVFYAAAA